MRVIKLDDLEQLRRRINKRMHRCMESLADFKAIDQLIYRASKKSFEIPEGKNEDQKDG